MMAILGYIPLFAIILVLYNIMAFSGVNFAANANSVFTISLISGGQWTPTIGDLMVMVGVICLYIEVFKATRTSVASIIDHSISTIVFVIFIVEFITIAEAGTSTFLVLALMSLFDVIAGFTITISSARRDMSLGGENRL